MAGLLDEMASVPDNLKRTLGGCWSTANAASTMARLLAERVPSTVLPTGTDARFAGLCGLLHDIGSLVAIKAFPDAYSRAGSRLLDGEGPFSEMLRDELGWDQARLASTWAAHWELPEALVSALRHQLEPDVEQPYQGLAAILHLTRVLCRSCGFVSGVDLFVEPIDPIALNLLGLKQNDLLAVLDDFFSEMAELELYESALGGGLADEAPVL
jgi:HD-like signal output (HDOD) protein